MFHAPQRIERAVHRPVAAYDNDSSKAFFEGLAKQPVGGMRTMPVHLTETGRGAVAPGDNARRFTQIPNTFGLRGIEKKKYFHRTQMGLEKIQGRQRPEMDWSTSTR